MVKFYMTIGVPASGKDFFYHSNLKNSIENIVHISSDAIRQAVYGDINDQTHNNDVFNIMFNRTVDALKKGRSVYYNATNLSRKKRINLLKQLPSCEKIAIVFAIPFELCCERNKTRDRVVPQKVMDRMYKSFQPPHWAEGFDRIKIVQAENNYGSIDDILAENIKCPHDNPHHRLSCGEHCLEAQRQADILTQNENFHDIERYIVSMAAKYHDVSKYKCKVFHNAKGETTDYSHYYCHENVSAYDFLTYAAQNTFNIFIANLIANHMIFFTDEKNIQRKKEFYGEDFWKLLEVVHAADLASH